ncbi:hypothetical protein [Haloterrigena salifodinae]|uniref:TFIIS-type domain-containing protein n=1 Tax=Haloterrigena salifodinae TaxID=2675099 RepID=A0A8T8E7A6_9EURY|nr:hypothetical protein JMJ58_22470 [Haloterrigena salifodinae]
MAETNCPATTANWPACGHTEVEFQQQQIRAVDEPVARLYRLSVHRVWRPVA